MTPEHRVPRFPGGDDEGTTFSRKERSSSPSSAHSSLPSSRLRLRYSVNNPPISSKQHLSGTSGIPPATCICPSKLLSRGIVAFLLEYSSRNPKVGVFLEFAQEKFDIVHIKAEIRVEITHHLIGQVLNSSHSQR